MKRSTLSLEELVQVMGAEAEYVALESARTLEWQRRREQSLQNPSYREWAQKQPLDWWMRTTQSWYPHDWEKRVASGEFESPSPE